MTKQVDKAALWKLIQNEHPSLASALTGRKKVGDSFVAIDSYPERTKEWIRQAIEVDSGLAKEVKDLEQIRIGFGGSGTISVDVTRLINALIRTNKRTLTAVNQ